MPEVPVVEPPECLEPFIGTKQVVTPPPLPSPVDDREGFPKIESKESLLRGDYGDDPKAFKRQWLYLGKEPPREPRAPRINTSASPRRSTLNFLNPQEERRALATMNKFEEEDGIVVKETPTPRTMRPRRPHAGYSVQMHVSRQEANIESQVSGNACNTNEEPLAITSPRCPAGPRALHYGRRHVVVAQADVAEAPAWAPLRGDLSTALAQTPIVPVPPTEQPTACHGNGGLRVLRRPRQRLTKPRDVLYFPIPHEPYLERVADDGCDGSAKGNENPMDDPNTSSTRSLFKPSHLQRPRSQGFSAQWVSQNSVPFSYRFAEYLPNVAPPQVGNEARTRAGEEARMYESNGEENVTSAMPTPSHSRRNSRSGSCRASLHTSRHTSVIMGSPVSAVPEVPPSPKPAQVAAALNPALQLSAGPPTVCDAHFFSSNQSCDKNFHLPPVKPLGGSVRFPAPKASVLTARRMPSR